MTKKTFMFDPLTDKDRERGEAISCDPAATVQSQGCAFEEYAQIKALPVDFLKSCGVTQIYMNGISALKLPYLDENGEEKTVRFRLANEGKDKFRWRKGSKTFLYGLSRLNRGCKDVVLVEGESDCHTLWHHGFNALGLPGATNWNESRDAAHFEGFETIYLVLEADQGGAGVMRWLQKSCIRNCVRIVSLGDYKDPSALHVANPAAFKKSWEKILKSSIPWSVYEKKIADTAKNEAWKQCAALARSPDILAEFVKDIGAAGLTGEDRNAKIIYLAVASRFLDKPVSIAVKGPSGGGKSCTTEKVLLFFPDSAFYALTAMSDRALAYSEEPLQHRFLVIYEASGMESDMASYLIRSLLSEGRLKYEFVEKVKGEMKARLIEREGPTGLIVTTTKTGLHPENETRLLSLTVVDTAAQTRNILLAMTDENRGDADLTRWHGLQNYLSLCDNRVTIPYSSTLAASVPEATVKAVRFRRDFRQILSLIKAHAILHQAMRRRDEQGRIVAQIKDYKAVHDLVVELIGQGIDATVSDEVREAVEAVKALTDKNPDGVTFKAVGDYLGLDKSAAQRRCNTAFGKGYLRNLEDKRGKSARLVIGDSLPDKTSTLPSPEELCRKLGDGCAVAAKNERYDCPPPTVLKAEEA